MKQDSWRYNLRKNSILTWVEELEKVQRFQEILRTCPDTSTLEIESGIVKIEPNARYIGHQFVPHVKAGFTFADICILLKSRIVEFESEYGKVELSDKDIYDLKQLVYQYNRQFMAADMNNKNQLIHLEQSAEVLCHLLSRTIILDVHINGWCSLTFTNNNSSHKDYCTIFSEDQVHLLKRVNNSILSQR